MKLFLMLFLVSLILCFGKEGKFNIFKAVRGKRSLYRNAPSYSKQIQNDLEIERRYTELKKRVKKINENNNSKQM